MFQCIMFSLCNIFLVKSGYNFTACFYVIHGEKKKTEIKPKRHFLKCYLIRQHPVQTDYNNRQGSQEAGKTIVRCDLPQRTKNPMISAKTSQ